MSPCIPAQPLMHSSTAFASPPPPPPPDASPIAESPSRWRRQPWVPAWSSQQNVRARYSRRAQHIHDSTLIMHDEIDIIWKPG